MAARAPVIAVPTPAAAAARTAPFGAERWSGLVPYLQVAPLALAFLVFFVVPMILVVVVSFFDYQSYDILIPDFTFQNYIDVFSEQTTWVTYLNTLKFCVAVWLITFALGFAIAYFLAFYGRRHRPDDVRLDGFDLRPGRRLHL